MKQETKKQEAKQDANASFGRGVAIMKAGIALAFTRAPKAKRGVSAWVRKNAPKAAALACPSIRADVSNLPEMAKAEAAKAAAALACPAESEALKAAKQEVKAAEAAKKATLARLPEGEALKRALNAAKGARFAAQIGAIGTASAADVSALIKADADAEAPRGEVLIISTPK